tara:strand:+ start:240 stop:467 length:228 start_codon:yes stop_codon:yes gene_type:complete
MNKSKLIDLFVLSIQDCNEAETQEKRSEALQVSETLAMFLSDKDKELAKMIASDNVIKAMQKFNNLIKKRSKNEA